MAEKLEKIVAELKHLNDDELNKVWGFALGLMARKAMDEGGEAA